MIRYARAGVVSLMAVAVLGMAAVPAAAAKPPWAGPPEVETVPIAESDPPFFVCDGEVLRFTAGTATFRFKQLPRDRGLFIVTLRDVEATSTDGEVFQVHGSAKGMFTGEDSGTFRLTFVFRGDEGSTERVNTRFVVRNGEESVTERGTCSTEGL